MSSPGCTSYRTRAPMLPPPGSLPGLYCLRLTLLQPVACFCLSFQGLRFVHLQSELPQQASPPSPFPGPSFVSLPSSAPWRTPVRLSNPGERHLLLGNPTRATILPGASAGTGASGQGRDTSPPACWLVSPSLRAGPAQSPREGRGAGHGRDGHGVPAVDRRAGVGRERVGRWVTLC